MSKLLYNVLKISGWANAPNAPLVARLPGPLTFRFLFETCINVYLIFIVIII